MDRVYKRRPVEERFWEKVDRTDGCWNWVAAISHGWYGSFCVEKGKTIVAHKFSWELANGPVPDGMKVCHSCDNPRCVRVDHLFLGTQAENLLDMSKKGRRARGHSLSHKGESHPMSSLTDELVTEARDRHAEGENVADLAIEMKVSKSAMKKAVHGHTWKHLPLR